MFKSIFAKYVSAFMLINIVCMIILTSIIASIINTYNTDVKISTLESTTSYVLECIEDGMSQSSLPNLRSYVGIYSTTLRRVINAMSVNVDEFVVFVSDESGEIILTGGGASSLKYGGDDGIFTNDEERYSISESHLEHLKTSGSYDEISTLGGMFDEKYIIYSVPVYFGGNFVGVVSACTVSSGMNDLLDGTVRAIIMSTLWLMLAVLVAVYCISERLISPIRAMSRAAKQFGKGKFDVRVPVRGNDEVAELATAFNNMAASLENNEEMRRLFLANVSHDLRTPMTTISGFIDGILDGAIPPEKHEYYLGVIASEVRRLSRLVMTLLDITKIQAGERKFNMIPFDVCEMCRQVLISSEQRIEAKRLNVDFRCDNDNMYAIGDTDAIHQVIYNLLDNAIKFSYDEGEYIIEVRAIDQKIEVSVYNEGVGISKEDLPYVFDRFYKSDKSRGLDKTGVGLGLYITKTIIMAHDESIKAESEQGKWCKFTFTLKRDRSKDKALPERTSEH